MSIAEADDRAVGTRRSGRRVVFSADVFTRQRAGGISRYHAELFLELRALGVDARVILGAHGHPYLPKGTEGSFRLPRYIPGRFALRAGDLATVVAVRTASTGDIYHPTYYTAPARAKGPTVITFHDLIHLRGLSDDPERARVVEGQRFWSRRADLVIAVSENTSRDLQELLGVPESKIRVVHLGVRPSSHKGPTAVLSQPTALYVGHRGGYKNWVSCVRAMTRSELRDWQLVCVGGGPVLVSELATVSAAGVSERVTFVEADDVTLDLWLRRSTALVYPSLYEGFGLPPLEAMVRGTPVVVSRRASIPEICGDGALLVEPNAAGIAEGLSRVLDQSTREQLIRRGIEHAAQFTWERTAVSTRRIYDELR